MIPSIQAFLAFALTFNNPHLYMAYEHKLSLFPVTESYEEFYFDYLKQTKSATGFYKRRPDSGDEISHDELLGIFYNVKNTGYGTLLAQRILKEGGYFYSHEKNKHDLSRYVMKHFDLRGIIALHAHDSVDAIDQVLWAFAIARRAMSDDDGCSYKLRTWIAAEFADQVPLPALAMLLFRHMMEKKGITVQNCMTLYFPNHPEMARMADGMKW
jgi:hypothetical protein